MVLETPIWIGTAKSLQTTNDYKGFGFLAPRMLKYEEVIVGPGCKRHLLLHLVCPYGRLSLGSSLNWLIRLLKLGYAVSLPFLLPHLPLLWTIPQCFLGEMGFPISPLHIFIKIGMLDLLTDMYAEVAGPMLLLRRRVPKLVMPIGVVLNTSPLA